MFGDDPSHPESGVRCSSIDTSSVKGANKKGDKVEGLK